MQPLGYLASSDLAPAERGMGAQYISILVMWGYYDLPAISLSYVLLTSGLKTFKGHNSL